MSDWARPLLLWCINYAMLPNKRSKVIIVPPLPVAQTMMVALPNSAEADTH